MGLIVDLGINLLATVLGILIVLLLERKRRPQLSMTIGQSSTIEKNDTLNRSPCTWLHVQIHNPSLPRFLAWCYDREPAFSCHAWVTFHHLDGVRVFDRKMNARWSDTPPPEIADMYKQTKTLPKTVQETVDIPPGEYANIDIALRLEGEDECYGWNNENYLYDNNKNPNWRLDKGRYIAQVTVKSAGRQFTDAFMVCNDVPYQDFRLETIDRKSKSSLK